MASKRFSLDKLHGPEVEAYKAVEADFKAQKKEFDRKIEEAAKNLVLKIVSIGDKVTTKRWYREQTFEVKAFKDDGIALKETTSKSNWNRTYHMVTKRKYHTFLKSNPKLPMRIEGFEL